MVRFTSALVLLAAAGSVTAGVAPAAAAPPGYRVVSKTFTAPPGALASGFAKCPRATVALSGGVFIANTSLDVDVNATVPAQAPAGWGAGITNRSGARNRFTVYAVCAKKPAKYTVVTGPRATAPPHGQARAIAQCPGKTVPLGGGGFSDTDASLNSTLPVAHGWATNQNNPGDRPLDFEAFAVCAKRLPGYAVVQSVPVDNPPGTQTGTEVGCPTGTVVVGGGAQSGSSETAVSLNGSFPVAPSVWRAFENHAAADGGDTPTFNALAACAS
jgi:hypothetical protein